MSFRCVFRASVAIVAFAAIAPAVSAQQQSCPATVANASMPLTYAGGATVPAITPCDLMTRLYIYAADSMRGREAGSPDAIRATSYIEREVHKLGLKPAGDNGTYFQNMPVSARMITSASSITVGGSTFKPDVDFTAGGVAADRQVSGDVVYGGMLGETAGAFSPDDVRGKIVVVTTVPGRGVQFGGRGGAATASLASAAAIAIVSPTIARPHLQYVLNDTMENEGPDW